jgi:hypothetical protein
MPQPHQASDPVKPASAPSNPVKQTATAKTKPPSTCFLRVSSAISATLRSKEERSDAEPQRKLSPPVGGEKARPTQHYAVKSTNADQASDPVKPASAPSNPVKHRRPRKPAPFYLFSPRFLCDLRVS